MNASGETLSGYKVAVLISDGFEQSEYEGPVQALQSAGADVETLAQSREQIDQGIRGIHHMEPGRSVKVKRLVLDVSPDDYDGLLIPGGALSCDSMRTSQFHLAFVRSFMNADKPIAAICHAGWLLADAGVLQGHTVTSWPAIRKDLERAGAVWKDMEVIKDGNLITSRKPADVPAFAKVLIETLAQMSRRTRRVA